MKVIGRTSQVIPLGVKLDECPACQAIATHAVARRVRWLLAFSLPLIRLGSDRVLICGNCGHETPIAGDLAAKGIKARSMQIERDRPVVEAAVAARTGAGRPNGLPPISLPRPDPALVRANVERRLQEVVPVRVQDRQALYDLAWPAVAAALAIAVIGGGGFLASQGAGVGLAGPQASQKSASASSAPASSPSPKPTLELTQRPFEAEFRWWKQVYQYHVLPCYTGGTCDLHWPIEYVGGFSAS